MSEVTLKELKEKKVKLEKGLSNMITKFQDKFGVEIREISIKHRQSPGKASPYSTEVSVDVKLT